MLVTGDASRDGSVVVPMGQYAVARGAAVLAAIGLGSCVAVILSDPVAHIGSLVHVLLPSQSLSRRRDNPARSADTAIPAVMRAMLDAGAESDRIVARLVGGSMMFSELLPAGAVHMGERNVVACRSGLRDLGVPIWAEAVGGTRGRSVWFDVGHNVVTVRSVGDEPRIL